MNTGKGLFIAFEGIDGSGTTSQSNLLQTELVKRNHRVVLQAEPTNGPIGAIIRQSLINRLSIDDFALALLFAADRMDHIYNPINGIVKFLNQGNIVLSDRYLLSSLCYQQDVLSVEEILTINKNFIVPDITFFLKVDPGTAYYRKIHSTPEREKYDIIEQQQILAKRYDDLLSSQKYNLGPIEIIDGEQSIRNIARFILDKTLQLIKEHEIPLSNNP